MEHDAVICWMLNWMNWILYIILIIEYAMNTAKGLTKYHQTFQIQNFWWTRSTVHVGGMKRQSMLQNIITEGDTVSCDCVSRRCARTEACVKRLSAPSICAALSHWKALTCYSLTVNKRLLKTKIGLLWKWKRHASQLASLLACSQTQPDFATKHTLKQTQNFVETY